MLYKDNARHMVLALKHGDRLDLTRPAARWLLQAARPMLQPGMLVAPVPLCWRRLFARRYNQAAILAAGIARHAGVAWSPAVLVRTRSTTPQVGLSPTPG